MLRIYSIGLEKMLNILAEEHKFLATRSKTYQHYWLDDNYIYLPIAKIKRVRRNCWVYNLEVEEDRSYVTECLTAHNCEAMAAGCVPVVISKGGQTEIVSDGKNGLLWKSREQLVKKTTKLIKNQKEWLKLTKAAQKKAQDFSLKRFCQKVVTLLK
jgi:glycosyltransferase involved in cell wall biosynthesis